MADVIDLSHYNEVGDWAVIKAAGIMAVIHKASEGSNTPDKTYSDRRQPAKDAGLLWGAYHFLRPGDMAQQAKYFLACAVPAADELICVDYEDDSLTLDDLEDYLAALFKLIERRAVIYSGNLIKEQVGNRCIPYLAAHRLWIAQYTTAAAPQWPQGTWPQWWLWQYTAEGNVPGVSGNVDCDLSEMDDDELRAAWSGDPAYPQPDPDDTGSVVTVTITAPPGVTVKIVQADA